MRTWFAGTILSLVLFSAAWTGTPSTPVRAQAMPMETAAVVETATPDGMLTMSPAETTVRVPAPSAAETTASSLTPSPTTPLTPTTAVELTATANLTMTLPPLEPSTLTPTVTVSSTAGVSPSPTTSPTATGTASPTETTMGTASPTETTMGTASPTATATGTTSPTETASPTPTASPTSTATATARPTATPDATVLPSPLPDAYEPNDSPEQAAPIDIGQRLEKLSFWPLGDIDYFVIEVKAGQVGLTLTLDTYQTFGLDTRLRLLGPDGRIVAENDDVDATDPRSHVAVALPAAGRYLIEASNHAATRPDFKTYSLQTAWQAAPQSPVAATTPTRSPGDAFENNYDFDHAAPIAVGEPVTDLTFVCPESDCADNDFFQVPLKGGRCYRAETIGLAAGIDTNLIVYGPERDHLPPLGGNDDVTPGAWSSRVDLCLPERVRGDDRLSPGR